MKNLLNGLKFPLALAFTISIGVNFLMMVSPIFMMQVFDRVLMSGHLETLYGLTLIAVVALLMLGAFDALRQQVLARAGDWLEREAGHFLIDAALAKKIPANETFQHIDSVKRFFCAQGVFSLLDSPWLFIFAGVLYWMHPWLGMAALGGAAFLFLIAFMTEIASRKPLSEASKHKRETQAILTSALRNADAVKSMGMTDGIKNRWFEATESAMTKNAQASERSAVLSGMAKSSRMIIQTGVLALGALLVLDNQLSPGGMIAASMLLGRCLAPVEQAIGAWKVFVIARDSWHQLEKVKEDEVHGEERIILPDPVGHLNLEKLSFQANTDSPPILENINFEMKPGHILVLVGPSGSGKSTLCRLLIGANSPTNGAVRLDGQDIGNWNVQQIGNFVGYMPQSVDLLPGSLKDNIQRFGEDDPEGVIQAAQRAGVDELIRSLEEGYESHYDMFDKPILSAGQLQRIGLARALYGDPKLIVLDEPNSNLDINGEESLSRSLRQMADEGRVVIVVTHRPSLLGVADYVGVMRDGKLEQFGPKEEVLKPKSSKKAQPRALHKKPLPVSDLPDNAAQV